MKQFHPIEWQAVGVLIFLSSFCFVSCDRFKQPLSSDESEKEKTQEIRDEVRRLGKGQKMEKLETLQGKVYLQVTITEVSAIGLSILHDSGSARIPFNILPDDLQQKFMFDRGERRNALDRENAALTAREASPAVTATPLPAKNKSQIDRKKVAVALASKEARLQTLEQEIYNKQTEIQNDESKLTQRVQYDSSGRYYRYTSNRGVSRAHILKGELEKKQRELDLLSQQIGILRTELNYSDP